MNYATVIAAALGAVAAAIITVLASRQKVRADATETLTNIALSLVEPQKKRISYLEAKITDMEESYGKRISAVESENKALHSWSQLLFTQVVENGGEPITFDYAEQLRGI